jgi:hypothetical protein
MRRFRVFAETTLSKLNPTLTKSRSWRCIDARSPNFRDAAIAA